MKSKKLIFIVDVDGTLTTGEYIYDSKGKKLKVFGPDDSDALRILNNFLKIVFVTGDKKGFPISKRRIVNDMKFQLYFVNSFERIEWIKNRFNNYNVIYMGDGIFDHKVFKKVFYSICPKNSGSYLKTKADYVSNFKGGNRAVADACRHILKNFFRKNMYSIDKI